MRFKRWCSISLATSLGQKLACLKPAPSLEHKVPNALEVDAVLAILSLMISVAVIFGCGRAEESELARLADPEIAVNLGYRGYARCTGAPRTMTRLGPDRTRANILGACPAEAMVFISNTAQSEIDGELYALSDQGWIDSRYLERLPEQDPVPTHCLARGYPLAFSHSQREATVTAMLALLSWSEGTGSCYNLMVGYKSFSSFAKHPNEPQPFGQAWSTAAGRYQFLGSTWDEVADLLGLEGFSPGEQDAAAVYYMRRRGHLPEKELKSLAEFSEAMAKLSYAWASLPPGRYGQPHHSVDVAWRRYQGFLESAKSMAPRS